MTGLEKILSQINADIDSTCADIKKKSDAQCTDIINSAHKQAETIKKNADLQAKAQAAEILKRAESSAQLQSRSVMLSAKQEIISSVLSGALEYLCSLPQKEYFELVYSMIGKYSEPMDGYILFSLRDKERLPGDFTDKVSQLAKGKLQVCSDVADIKGGFILKYEGIEVNCAFESIFLSENERFSDTASSILFPHGRSL